MSKWSNGKWKKAALILLVFFGIYLISYFILPQSFAVIYAGFFWSKILFDIISTFLLSCGIVEICLYIDNKMNKYLPWTGYAIKRLFLQTCIQVLVILFFLIFYASLTFVAMHVFGIEYQFVSTKFMDVWYYVLATISLTLIVSTLNTVNYLSSNLREAIINATAYKIKAAESKQLIAETELQALRLQLDPHFVFNNLSILSELILKDQQLGFEYTDNFAKVYRYLLINAKRKVIELHEELAFLDSYLFLVNNRIGLGVRFDINIDVSKMDLKIPPITLQLLVENAIKFNCTEKDKPLLIRIFTNDEDELIVYNNLLPMVKNPVSSGIGLSNIFSRYALLSSKQPKVQQNETSFVVIIPLLT